MEGFSEGLNFEPTIMMAEAEVFPCKLLRGCAHWDVRLEETTHPVDRALLQFLRLLPRVYRDLGVGRQRGNINRGLQRMRWYIIWQHKHRRSAAPDKVTRHAVQEIGLNRVQIVQVCLDRVRRHIGAPLHEV